jgi:serine protease AprX
MSALWGTGGRPGGEGRGSRRTSGRERLVVLGIVAAFVLALTAPFAGVAAAANGPAVQPGIYVPAALLASAQASPQQSFQVIVQGDGSANAAKVAQKVAQFAADANHTLADAAHKADDAVDQAQNALNDATHKASDAQTAATKAQADAAAKAQKAAQTGKKGDQDDAAHAAQDAAKALAALNQAQAAVSAAQAALTQAQAAANAAHAAVSQSADTILKQQITDQFSSITGVAATLTGDQIVALVTHPDDGGLLSVTPDAPVQTTGYSNTQLWPYVSGSASNWGMDGDPNVRAAMPSIAIVDSGIQSQADLGNRVIAAVNLSSLPGTTAGVDGRGHGTFVAGIAAGQAPNHVGADPVANLIDVKVMDSTGMGLTSDVIRACQWILDNKAKYDIRVANFSLHSDINAPFYVDPLDRAVEQLWFNGVTVVAAAGNYGVPTGPSGVLYSPGDDPFVITVGAADVGTSAGNNDDSIAPWSAWGYTGDGFAKPELSAPGRYMIGPVPPGATLLTDFPSSVVSSGYMELSGTSFAAPVVSAAAAQVLAKHPTWTPDQVKGALMLSAKPLPSKTLAGGVGELTANDAIGVASPPNPNLALEQYVSSSGSGGSGASSSFNSASWNSAAKASASWNSASWNSASWNSASWNSASWNSASWNSASWNSASWNSVSSASASREDAAEGDTTLNADALRITPADIAAILASNPTLAGALP